MPDSRVSEVQPHDNVLLVAILKRTLDERSVDQLVDDVHTAAGQRPSIPIVLDLSRVKFAPSVALGALVKLSRSFELDGRRIALIGVDDRIMGTLRVTRLDSILEIHRSIDDVIARAKGRR